MLTRIVFAVAAIAAVALGAAPVAGAAPWQNCTEARDNGDVNIPSTSDTYGPHLDRDQDGIGCEA
ncbi:excalibur calcium-binding domain-containing protein [Mycobacterium sp. NPDC003323]